MEEKKDNTLNPESSGTEVGADVEKPGAAGEAAPEKESPAKNENAKASKSGADKKEIAKLKAEVVRLGDGLKNAEKALSEEKDKYLRMMAEYDNFRKRSQREKEAAYTDAYGEALTALLPIMDNMTRALDYADSASLADGVKMIVSQFNDVLSRLGIEAFGEAGEEFDPSKHSAVMHVDDENLGENVIAQVLQRGYKRGEKILRFAVVQVAN